MLVDKERLVGNIVDMNNTDNNKSTAFMIALSKFAGINPRMIDTILHNCGHPEEILSLNLKSLLEIEGIDDEATQRITEGIQSIDDAEVYLQLLKERDIAVITRLDTNFPKRLLELNDPPSVLYVRGSVPENAKHTIAIAGTFKASNEGIESTVSLARACASQNVQVVSKLSPGIGSAAQIGCKSADGVSFAILDSGMDNLVGTEQTSLAIDIIQSGGIMSEHPPETTELEEVPLASNRILAGLAQAVVITELYEDSTNTLDLLECCDQIGMLTFILTDSEDSILADETSLRIAADRGAIVLTGQEKIENIFRVLV